MWWYMPIIPILRRLRQEDLKLEANVVSENPSQKQNKIFYQT
jgi:hypothetical protein